MATHCSILTWKMPRTEEPGGLQSTGSQRARYNLAIKPPPPPPGLRTGTVGCLQASVFCDVQLCTPSPHGLGLGLRHAGQQLPQTVGKMHIASQQIRARIPVLPPALQPRACFPICKIGVTVGSASKDSSMESVRRSGEAPVPESGS